MAGQIRGIDCIGGRYYLKALKAKEIAGISLGFLIEARGWDKGWRAVNQAARREHHPVIKVAGIWRDSHRFGNAEHKEAFQIALRLNKLQAKFPKQKFQYNPFLEIREGVSFREKAYSDIRKVLNPKIDYIDNPESVRMGVLKKRGIILELHHNHYKTVSGINQSFSFDGLSGKDADFQKYHRMAKRAHAFWHWTWELNGKASKKDGAKRPDRKNWANKKLLIALAEQLRTPVGKTKLSRKWLYKAFADNHGDGHPRTNKPLFLIPKKAGKIELKAKGKVFATAKYEKQFPHDKSLHLYRFDDWGFEIAERVMKIKKRPNVNVIINGKKVGRINPLFREGYFLNQD